MLSWWIMNQRWTSVWLYFIKTHICRIYIGYHPAILSDSMKVCLLKKKQKERSLVEVICCFSLQRHFTKCSEMPILTWRKRRTAVAMCKRLVAMLCVRKSEIGQERVKLVLCDLITWTSHIPYVLSDVSQYRKYSVLSRCHVRVNVCIASGVTTGYPPMQPHIHVLSVGFSATFDLCIALVTTARLYLFLSHLFHS